MIDDNGYDAWQRLARNFAAKCDEEERLAEEATSTETRQRPAGELVYKDYGGPQPAMPQPLSADSSAAWNSWWDDKFSVTAVPMIGKTIGELLVEMRRELRKEFQSKLAEELGSLRADQNVQHTLLRGEITEIKKQAGDSSAKPESWWRRRSG
jgi:hypothetical protein